MGEVQREGGGERRGTDRGDGGTGGLAPQHVVAEGADSGSLLGAVSRDHGFIPRKIRKIIQAEKETMGSSGVSRECKGKGGQERKEQRSRRREGERVRERE